jgi:hypothetical protein
VRPPLGRRAAAAQASGGAAAGGGGGGGEDRGKRPAEVPASPGMRPARTSRTGPGPSSTEPSPSVPGGGASRGAGTADAASLGAAGAAAAAVLSLEQRFDAIGGGGGGGGEDRGKRPAGVPASPGERQARASRTGPGPGSMQPSPSVPCGGASRAGGAEVMVASALAQRFEGVADDALADDAGAGPPLREQDVLFGEEADPSLEWRGYGSESQHSEESNDDGSAADEAVAAWGGAPTISDARTCAIMARLESALNTSQTEQMHVSGALRSMPH